MRDHRLENRMESFFLAETTKYLYLLFDADNFLHNAGDRGDLVQTPSGPCVLDAGGYVFNTEAHPIDLAALHCCSATRRQEEATLHDFHLNLNLLDLLGLARGPDSAIVGTRLRKKPAKAPTSEGPAEEGEGGRQGAGATDTPRRTLVRVAAGPGGEQGEGHHDAALSESAAKRSRAEEAVATSPEANIKMTIVKTSLRSAGKLPSQAASGGDGNPQPSASATVSVKVNSEQLSTETGRQKHSFDLAQQILDLFSSVTKQPENRVEDRLPSVADLYAAVANYSIAYASKPAMMRCPAQPFHSRLSVWGEMFQVDDVPSQ